MLYVFLYHTPNPEKLQVFSHFPHKIHPKSGTNPHFLTILHFQPLSSPSHSRKSLRRLPHSRRVPFRPPAKNKSPRPKSLIASPHSILFQFSHQLSHEIPAPAGISFSGLISARFPSASSAHSSIPSDTIPASLAGFRFVTTMTFLPTISSGE